MTQGFAEWSESAAPHPPARVVVRAARLEDAEAAQRMQVASNRSPLAPGDWERMIAEADRCVLIAREGPDVVGWASTKLFAEPDGPALAGHYLGGVTVAPSSRRRGVGHALTAARLDWIAERADEAWYFANAMNRVSIRLHEPFGFVLVATVAHVHGATFEGGAGHIFRASIR